MTLLRDNFTTTNTFVPAAPLPLAALSLSVTLSALLRSLALTGKERAMMLASVRQQNAFLPSAARLVNKLLALHRVSDVKRFSVV